MTSHIVFCGTSAFALPSLQALIDDERFTVDLVITQPDKPVGRKQALTASPVKAMALAKGIPILQPANINAEWTDIAAAIKRPEFLVVVSYGQILKRHILHFPTVAAVNVHASLLPKLRGASPIQHAILRGAKQTGVTVQRMAEELDAGPLLAQLPVAIGERATTPMLHDALARVGAELLLSTLNAPLNEIPQDETKATWCKKLSRKDGIVDPKRLTAEEIDRRVRALVPWPGVTWGDVKLLETDLKPHPQAMPLPCAEKTILYVSTLQPAGKKPMGGAEYVRGLRGKY